MLNSTNNEKVICVNPTTSITAIKPSFQCMGKFISNVYKETHTRFNEVVIVIKIACKCFLVKNKLIFPWKKSCESLCNNSSGLFLLFKFLSTAVL